MRVDFISESDDNGAVGVFKDGFQWVSSEDGSFSTTSNEIALIEADGMLYQSSDILIQSNTSSETNTIIVGDGIGVTVVHSYGGKG